MFKENLENTIAERFNQQKNIFPEKINSSDFRVRATFDFFGNVHGKKILDVGCGKGRFSALLSEKGAHVIGVDISNGLLEIARKRVKNVRFEHGSATNLPFPDNSFDYVLCIETLEHIPDIEKALKEMARVLCVGGGLIIIDKNKLSLNKRLFIPNVLIKKSKEILNTWFYPRNFPFTEKWFFNTEVSQMLKKYYKDVGSYYLSDRKRMLFRLFPFLNLFIVWKSIKYE